MENLLAQIIIYIIIGLIIAFIYYHNTVKKQKEKISLMQKQIDDFENRATGIYAREKLLAEDYLAKTNDIKAQEEHLKQENINLNAAKSKLTVLKSNLTALPYMAAIIADFDTRGLEILARKLDWGYNIQREKKVASIREIRKNAEELIEQYKVAYYQLEYLKSVFPAISDFIETDYTEVQNISFDQIQDENRDNVRDYLTKEEYEKLSQTQRNQLALDRYVASHHKSKWQIGRDYEIYVGYEYQKKGYTVDFFGNNNGLNDLGRDVIATKGNKTLIIQCKYWSSSKEIHENHICQLYGTTICYCLEHNLPVGSVDGLLVTNIKLSDTARMFAKYLNITVVENLPMKDFPRIKCNINRDSYGLTTKIYHLPFDQQYDSCKINAPGEFFALTVNEAEKAGFRRAFRHFSTD